MPGKETSFSITLPTLVFLVASIVAGAIEFGAMASSLKIINEVVMEHDSRIRNIDEKLNHLLGNSEALQGQVARLNDKFDKLK